MGSVDIYGGVGCAVSGHPLIGGGHNSETCEGGVLKSPLILHQQPPFYYFFPPKQGQSSWIGRVFYVAFYIFGVVR